MEKCLQCQELFKPRSAKQKFCSDKCKVAYSRMQKRVTGYREGAHDIDEYKKIPNAFVPGEKEYWVLEIEQYCELASITPLDLIECHKLQNKPYKKLNQGEKLKIEGSDAEETQPKTFHDKLRLKKLKSQHRSD